MLMIFGYFLQNILFPWTKLAHSHPQQLVGMYTLFLHAHKRYENLQATLWRHLMRF